MRLLVVEDDSKLRALLKRGLEEEGYAVDAAKQAAEADWLGTETPYDAIIMDVALPDGNGFDAVDDRIRGLDAGADDYLTKPFAFEELLARIRCLLRRGQAPRPVRLKAGPLVLDPGARRVMVNGALVKLTAREFALLELLMRRAGEVLSRTDIRERLWDHAFDGDSNVVDVYVGYIRKKIDRAFELNLIETVRGAGYRLRGDTHAPADQG
jgi:two-component system OmpR family response regulator